MRLFPRLMLVALWPTLAAADQVQTSDGPMVYYLVERAEEPVKIDGIADEFSWSKSRQINSFERILNDYDEILYRTRTKMLWDEQYFYFFFACQDADMWAIYQGEDDKLWEEEVVEVFIDPDGDGKNYLELEVNPLNAVVDLLIYSVSPEWHSSTEWDIAGLKTAVKAYGTANDSLALDEGWTAEIAIPWAAMADSVTGGGRPGPGDVWRLNLYRIERKGGRDLKGRINALQAKAAPIHAQIDALWSDREEDLASGERDEALLDETARQRLASLNKRLEPINEELAPLRDHYHEQTEYTAWSETYTRGFHHPNRFGAVQFAE